MFDVFSTKITRVSEFPLVWNVREFELAGVMVKPHIRLPLRLHIPVAIRSKNWSVGSYTDRDRIAALRTGIRQELGKYLAQSYVEPKKSDQALHWILLTSMRRKN